MRTILLTLLVLLYLTDIYSQGFQSKEERSSLGISFVNRSFHHIHDYILSSPVVKFDQEFHWKDWIVSLSSGYMPEQFTILRNADLGLRYRSRHPYRSNWFEAGIAYQYDKQDPSISHSGKLSGWTLMAGAHQKLSNWFTHEGRGSVGFHKGFAMDLRNLNPQEYNAVELFRFDFSYVLLNLQYAGEVELNPFLFGTSVQYLYSRYTREAYLSLFLKRKVSLSAGQLLKVGSGVRVTCFREFQPVISKDNYSESFRDDASNIAPETISPVQFFVNLKMIFLRGEKQRAF